MGSPAQICFRWHPCQLNPYTRLAVRWLAWVRAVIKGWGNAAPIQIAEGIPLTSAI